MPEIQEHLVVRLDQRSLEGLARSRRTADGIRVFVPYTRMEMASAALRQAAVLTRNLSAHITLFTVHVVPFPLPLDRPNVSATFL